MITISKCTKNSQYSKPFEDIAKWVWGKLESANKHRISFNEETITESILLKLAENFYGKGLKIKSYSKAEEGRGTVSTDNIPTGADWSFWFENREGKGIEIRIQAKRIFNSGKYESLDGNAHSSPQITKLIKSSETAGAIPLYIFYNGPSNNIDPKFDLTYNCENFISKPDRLNIGTAEDEVYHHICKPNDKNKSVKLPGIEQDLSRWGCTFASAFSIPKKLQPKPEDIPMRPWHCMVCSHTSSNSKQKKSLPEIIIETINITTKQSINNDTGHYDKEHHTIRETPPEWVKYLKRIRTNEENSLEINTYLQRNELQGIALFQEI